MDIQLSRKEETMINKKIALTLIIFSVMMAIPIVSATTIETDNNTTIILTMPPQNATIIKTGHGDIDTPENYYYDADYTLTEENGKNFMYIYNINNNSANIKDFIIWIPIIAVIVMAVIWLMCILFGSDY